MENQTDNTKPKEEKANSNMVDSALLAAERLEAAADRIEAANMETARLQARAALGGMSEAGAKAPAKVELTDIEYANLVRAGLRNPLKEDGYL